MKLSTLIDGFLLDCRARKLSPATINRAYHPPLKELCDWLKDPQIDRITTSDLREFVIYEQERNKFATGKHPWMAEVEDTPISAHTVHRYVRVFKTLFNWAVAEGLLSEDQNPSINVKYPQLPDSEIEVLNKSQIDELLKAAKEASYRDYALVVLMLDSGLRRNEVVNLTLDDVNVVNGLITVRHGKGDKDRRVRVGYTCRKVLWRYANEFRKPAHPNVDSFFLDRTGEPLSYNAIGMMFTHLAQKLGYRIYPHKLRHTFATIFARQTPNAITLAHALGHEEISMARKYVHFALQDPPEDVLSPVDLVLDKSK
jgi:site-specific recombinase XerD